MPTWIHSWLVVPENIERITTDRQTDKIKPNIVSLILGFICCHGDDPDLWSPLVRCAARGTADKGDKTGKKGELGQRDVHWHRDHLSKHEHQHPNSRSSWSCPKNECAVGVLALVSCLGQRLCASVCSRLACQQFLKWMLITSSRFLISEPWWGWCTHSHYNITLATATIVSSLLKLTCPPVMYRAVNCYLSSSGELCLHTLTPVLFYFSSVSSSSPQVHLFVSWFVWPYERKADRMKGKIFLLLPKI